MIASSCSKESSSLGSLRHRGTPGETITLVAFQDVTLAMDDLLPPRGDFVD
jgi:hypothetical protein